MADELTRLEKICETASAGKYRVRIHAVRHMVEEGFTETDLLTALQNQSRIVEDYPDEARCLALGYFLMGSKVRLPLHIVCDYSCDDVIDFVTAYIPQRPWWQSPTQRGNPQ